LSHSGAKEFAPAPTNLPICGRSRPSFFLDPLKYLECSCDGGNEKVSTAKGFKSWPSSGDFIYHRPKFRADIKVKIVLEFK
jgi:hypothetical protein